MDSSRRHCWHTSLASCEPQMVSCLHSGLHPAKVDKNAGQCLSNMQPGPLGPSAVKLASAKAHIRGRCNLAIVGAWPLPSTGAPTSTCSTLAQLILDPHELVGLLPAILVASH